MAKINSLRDIIQFNSNFKTAINLYLSLNKAEKVLGYIPTKSSVSFLGEYLKAVLENKEQATLLVGPYGKGKSHLLLVLLAVLSMKKTPESESAINELIDNVSKTDEVGERVSEYIGQVWDKKRFLPVLITDTTGDLNQAFLYGLNDALKRDGLLDLAPETYYSIALDRIDDWEQNYFETYKMFERELTQNGMSIAELKTDLKQYSQKTLILFKEIYPKVTAGSEFNPMALADALPLYKSVSEKLVDEYGYSGIYIVFDEFSKFIEGQNNIAAGTNMHLLQSMCELATDSKNAQVFITMVAHKSIKEYGKYLSRDLINLFTGIEGRIIEKYFVTSSKNNYELIKNAIVKDDSKLLNIPHYEKYLGKEKFKEFYSLPAFRSGFDETEFKNVIFNGCYPLNPIAAYLLLNISEKVAQNERTLFTFISNDEPHSMARFVSEHTLDKEWSIGADLIYEYFSALFKKDVVNEFIHNIWLSAEYAIDKCDTEDQRKIVKALAVILIVNKEDEIPATEKYLKLCINASDPEQALMELKKKEFIYKKNSTDSYVFKTRAGSELKAEIKRQRELKGENVNYSKVLLDVTGNYFIIPRKYNTVKMMTRYFTNEFMSVDDFLNITSSTALLDNTLDGKVITLYSFSRIKQEAVKQHLLELAEKRLVVICPKKGLKAKKQLKDYEIISDLKGNQVFTNNNEILKRELPLLLDDLTTELEIIIGDVYEDDLDTKVLYFDGGRIKNAKSGNVEKAVNECCLNVYTSTPIINNEMVNRAEIGTAQTKKAKVSRESLYDRISKCLINNKKYNEAAFPKEIRRYIPLNYNASTKIKAVDTRASKSCSGLFLEVLGLYCNNKNYDPAEAKCAYSKSSQILKLSEEEIDSNCEKVCIAMDRAFAFLQIRCGVQSLSDVNYKLMIRLIAYIFTNDKWYGSEKVHDIIEAWYWAAIFSGEYDKDQNERFEKNLRSILETLTTKAKKYDWIITLKNNIFETPYFSDCSFLLMEKANEDRIPKEHLAKYICQFYLSRTYSDLIHDDRQINVFSKYKLEKHHIVPVGSVSKIGESTDILRKDKTNIVNSPLNYVFISDATNLEISNISLKEYEQDITASAKAALNIVNYPSVEKLNDKTTIKAWLKERYKILKGQIQNRVMNMLLS